MDLPFGKGSDDSEESSRRCGNAARYLDLCWAKRANAKLQVRRRQPKPVGGCFDEDMGQDRLCRYRHNRSHADFPIMPNRAEKSFLSHLFSAEFCAPARLAIGIILRSPLTWQKAKKEEIDGKFFTH